MELLFLGTGAAEGYPPVYAQNQGRKIWGQTSGRDLRLRSALRIGKRYQIDISPDNHVQNFLHGVDMHFVEDILITHTHCDHFNFNQVADKSMARNHGNGKKIHLHMTPSAAAWTRKVEQFFVDNSNISNEEKVSRATDFPIHTIDYFTKTKVGELEVEVIKGNHLAYGEDEASANYIITLPNQKKFLYATDTGYYTEETWNYLKGKTIDTLIIESTWGNTRREEFPDGHLDCFSCVKVFERMEELGVLSRNTPIYLTHINPHHTLNHSGLQEYYDQTSFTATVAWDGLKLKI